MAMLFRDVPTACSKFHNTVPIKVKVLRWAMKATVIIIASSSTFNTHHGPQWYSARVAIAAYNQVTNNSQSVKKIPAQSLFKHLENKRYPGVFNIDFE